MSFLRFVFLLGLIAASGPFVVHAWHRGKVYTQCFNDYLYHHKEFHVSYLLEGPGPTYTVDNAILNFCASHPFFQGWGYETRHCFPFIHWERAHDMVNADASRWESGNSLQIAINNDRPTVAWIAKEECVETIRSLIYKCEPGGIFTLGPGFHLFVFPSESPCPPPMKHVKEPWKQFDDLWASPW
jgi:hypothetical protein